MASLFSRVCHSWGLFCTLLLLCVLHSSLSFTSRVLEKSFHPRRRSQSRQCWTFALHQQQQQHDDDDNDDWTKVLLETFSGDFDNYHQVVEDRKNGLLPREGGGHEHIHCTLIPVSEKSRLAAFYFDGMPDKIFRFRYYQFEKSNATTFNMTLYTLNTALEQELRNHALDPTEWPRIFYDFESTRSLNECVKLLPNCDIAWSRTMDRVQHQYAMESSLFSPTPTSTLCFHAIMIHGQAIVESTMIPGQSILIKDQLSLSPNDFWIHDRGYNPKSGEFIYGNQRGIPYQLQRVTRWNSQGKRVVVNTKLQWTLGEKNKTQDEYDDYINAISS